MLIFLSLFVLFASSSDCKNHFFGIDLAEQFEQIGYVEICNTQHTAQSFDSFYFYFDECIEFLQSNPAWAYKLCNATDRFIRSKERNYYSTDFFGFYDESKRAKRSQISFYYSVHFHEYLCSRFPELNKVPEINRFLKACLEIQKPYENLFEEIASELGLQGIFHSEYGRPPILLKVIKYLSSYVPTRPHYDGTAFSLFLDSTDPDSLLLSPYKSSFSREDFSASLRKVSRGHNQISALLIPGTFLKEFSIDPTPHFVAKSGKIRYAAIAFAMRPNYTHTENKYSILPNF